MIGILITPLVDPAGMTRVPLLAVWSCIREVVRLMIVYGILMFSPLAAVILTSTFTVPISSDTVVAASGREVAGIGSSSVIEIVSVLDPVQVALTMVPFVRMTVLVEPGRLSLTKLKDLFAVSEPARIVIVPLARLCFAGFAAVPDTVKGIWTSDAESLLRAASTTTVPALSETVT